MIKDIKKEKGRYLSKTESTSQMQMIQLPTGTII